MAGIWYWKISLVFMVITCDYHNHVWYFPIFFTSYHLLSHYTTAVIKNVESLKIQISKSMKITWLIYDTNTRISWEYLIGFNSINLFLDTIASVPSKCKRRTHTVKLLTLPCGIPFWKFNIANLRNWIGFKPFVFWNC